jgi:hypothetical protein
MKAIDRVLMPKYQKALEEGPGNKFFDFMLDKDGKHPSTEERVRTYLQVVIEKMRRESGTEMAPKEKEILSDDSSDTKAIRAFIEKKLKPGERMFVLSLTGQGKDPNRSKVLRAMHKKVKAEKRDPWSVLKLDLELQEDNPHDPNAVTVYCWWQHKSGTWKRHHIGFLKRSHMGKEIHHNKVIAEHMRAQKVKRVRYKKMPHAKAAKDFLNCFKVYALHVFAPRDSKTPALKLAVIADHLTVNSGTIPNYYRHPETEKIHEGTDGLGGSPPPKKKAGKKKAAKVEAPPQEVEVRDWPTVEQMSELMEILAEFERFFYHSEEVDGRKGVLMPVCMHEWKGTPKKLTSAKKVEEAVVAGRMGEFYGDFGTAVDLYEIQEKHGVLMAENFYRITGGFAGPIDKMHIQSILQAMRRVLKVLREFKGMNNE